MEIVKAKNAGFCFGVKRAIESAYKELESTSGEIYSIGPLIHNEIVTGDLKKKGLIELNDVTEIKNLKNKKVIIRTHGIEKDLLKTLKDNGNDIIDLTCPFVKKIHEYVRDYTDKGYEIIVIGDKNHPEVKGIVSYAKSNIRVIIDKSDIERLNLDKNADILVLFQTTTNKLNAEKLVDILSKLSYNIKVINTICNATENRQQEVSELAKVSDAMFIVGSKNSSNTMKLYDIARSYCDKTYLISSIDDLSNIDLQGTKKIGVSAGASTPDYLIEEILTNGRFKF